MGRVETNNEKVVHAFVVEQEESRECHKTESMPDYVAILVYLPLKRLCWSNHLSTSILRPILFSIEKEAKKSTTAFALVSASPVMLNLLSL